ncbi:oxidoreductase, partial [Vibrio parahaemolyticus]|nr:oxidoreductase [Vibrio parahaemolyticus]
DLHPDGVIKEAAANPSHFSKIFEVAKKTGPVAAFRELRAKFSDYSVIGYSGSGTIIDVGPGISDLKIGQRVAYGGEGTGHGEFVS